MAHCTCTHQGSYKQVSKERKKQETKRANHQPLEDAPEECTLSLSPSYLSAERLGRIVGPLTDPFMDSLTEGGADMVLDGTDGSFAQTSVTRWRSRWSKRERYGEIEIKYRSFLLRLPWAEDMSSAPGDLPSRPVSFFSRGAPHG